jgi:GNAT superfamily N-acetyltransferase
MVTIREYRTGERDLLRAMALELHETLRPFDSCLAPGNDIIDEYLQYVLSTIEETNGAVLLADREGEPAGYLCLIGARQPEDTDLVPEPFAVVADLFVRSTCRGFGVGEQLMAEAERRAQAMGAVRLELQVLSGNGGALRFYHRLGYEDRVVTLHKRFAR